MVMTMPMFEDDRPTRTSLRIPPLQDPFPSLSTGNLRPPPLEPYARVDISDEATKLTGRRKALAQAKLLDAPDSSEWRSLTSTSNFSKSQDEDTSRQRSRKRQKSCDQELITEFVQLPKPLTRTKEEKPRPFRPIAVLNGLHEPPPSAALFPPITPNASREELEAIVAARERSIRGSKAKREMDRLMERRTSKRTYHRGRTKWTEKETEQLVKGVAIYGMGRWKSILNHSDFDFKEGRTSVDLKDRFRVCFPPNAPHKWIRPLPEKAPNPEPKHEVGLGAETDDDGIPEFKRLATGLPQSKAQAQRAPKRHWTDEEDSELEKGFRRHGYQWNLIVKDPDLSFDKRTASQVRDRFRLRFKELYAQQGVTIKPRKTVKERDLKSREAPANVFMPTLTKNTSNDSVEQVEAEEDDDDDDDAVQGKASCKASVALTTVTLLNGEDEDNRLSNSILHNDWDWDENLTLAPLAWEEMAAKPIFPWD